jgi:hypothetical protein
MVVPQLKKDTARHFYCYPFLWNIYSLSQDKLKYKRKNDELIEQNKTRRSYWRSWWRKRGINQNALAMAPGACEGGKSRKVWVGNGIGMKEVILHGKKAMGTHHFKGLCEDEGRH